MKVSLEGLDLGPQAAPCGSVNAGKADRYVLALAVNLTALETFFAGFGESRFLAGLRKQSRAATELCLVMTGPAVHAAVTLGRMAGEAAQDDALPVEGVAQWWAEAARASFALGALGGGLDDPDGQGVAKSVHKACRAALRLLYRDSVADAILCRATGDESGDFLIQLADDVVNGGFSI